MRLKRGQQVSLIILGLAVFTLGVTASAREWPTAGIITLIFPGLLMIVFGFLGVFPNVHLKEGNVEWPKIAESTPVEPVEAPHTDKIAEHAEKIAEHTDDIAQLDRTLAFTISRLERLILAHQRPPDDGLTDDERLRRLQDAYTEVDNDRHSRINYGKKPNDDMTIKALHEQAKTANAALRKELRRQKAQFEFGMRDEPPAREVRRL